jgi:MFS family permease
MENDPLYRMRHALAGMALALLASVFIAAFSGAFVADLFADSYGARVAVYAVLLLYVVVGTGFLFVRVAQHETRPLTAGRLALWLASLWLWPLLLLRQRAVPETPPPPG